MSSSDYCGLMMMIKSSLIYWNLNTILSLSKDQCDILWKYLIFLAYILVYNLLFSFFIYRPKQTHFVKINVRHLHIVRSAPRQNTQLNMLHGTPVGFLIIYFAYLYKPERIKNVRVSVKKKTQQNTMWQLF